MTINNEQDANSPESAVSLLEKAHSIHASYISEAEEYKERVEREVDEYRSTTEREIDEYRERSERETDEKMAELIAEAQAERDRVLGGLEAQEAALKAEVKRLEGLEADARQHLAETLSSLAETLSVFLVKAQMVGDVTAVETITEEVVEVAEAPVVEDIAPVVEEAVEVDVPEDDVEEVSIVAEEDTV